jgi:prepilin-type N-terminal cleavage/methylation domain-containing protein
MKKYHNKGQAGFTLIELLVGLAILTLLAVSVSGAFDGSRSRAQALVSAMSEVGNANIRFKADTGCYALHPEMLTSDATAADATTNTCNKNLTTSWNGPYLSKVSLDTTNHVIKFDKISSGVGVSLPVPEAGGIGKRYYVRAINLPNDVVKRALQECNNDPVESLAAVEFNTKKCRGLTTATDGDGEFHMVYDETK